MRRAQAVEAVALHDARGALALADAGDVDDPAGGERLSVDLLPEGVGRRIGGAQFDDVLAGVTPAASKWPDIGLVTFLPLTAPKPSCTAE